MAKDLTKFKRIIRRFTALLLQDRYSDKFDGIVCGLPDEVIWDIQTRLAGDDCLDEMLRIAMIRPKIETVEQLHNLDKRNKLADMLPE